MRGSTHDATTEPATRTAGQVARVLGIAESTLRAWHRRYGLGPHPSSPGGYRRYGQEDMATLQHMRDLIRDGALPSDAARIVQAAAPGGHPEQWISELLAASYEIDTARCRSLLEGAIAQSGVLETWERLCRPVLAAIDASQQAENRADPSGKRNCVEREHALSWSIIATLHRSAPEVGHSRSKVLLACADAEQHTLAMEVLAAALAERGVGSRMLGAAVPAAGLMHAASTTRPDVVVVWAQRPDTADPGNLAALRRLPVRRVAAGPGWTPGKIAGATLVTSLPDAVTLVCRAASGSQH